MFGRQGKLYMLTSGMSGYVPNQSDAAISGGYDDSPTEHRGKQNNEKNKVASNVWVLPRRILLKLSLQFSQKAC